MIERKILARYWPEGIILILIIFALVPVFATPGFLFFLDWVWAPAIAPIHIDNVSLLSSLPTQIISHALSFFFSSEHVQKILLALPILTIGTGAMVFTRSIISKTIPHTSIQIIVLSVGIFAMFNPFTLNRVSLGHIHLLLGYAGTFWTLAALVRALENPTNKRLITAGAFVALPLLISIHHLILLPLAIALLLLRRKQYRKNFRSHALILILPSALYILALAFAGYAHDAWVGHRIITEHTSVFALQYPCTGTPIDIATLTASWRPSPATCPGHILPALGWTVLAVLMLYGTTELWALALACTAILLTYFTKDIAQAIPAWGAMRDSGKFISLLVIVESALIASGAMRIYKKIPNIPTPIMILLTVCSISLPLFSEFSEIITPRQYPQSWIDFAKTLREIPGEQSVLFLPQKTYVTLQFAGSVPVANPAPIFFSDEHIISTPEQDLSLDYKTLAQEHISYIALASSDPRAIDIQEEIQDLPHLKQLSKNTDLSVWEFVP